MKLTPLDIHHKEFHRAIRGYNEEEVDKFLDEVAEEFERMFKENIDLKEQAEKSRQELEGYSGMEKTLQSTLLTAQRSAEDVLVHARKEAELIVRDAEVKAKEVIQEAYDLKGKYEATLSHLKDAEVEFRNKFKSMLESYMRIADSTAVLAEIGTDIANDQPSAELEQLISKREELQASEPVAEIEIPRIGAVSAVEESRSLDDSPFFNETPMASEYQSPYAEQAQNPAEQSTYPDTNDLASRLADDLSFGMSAESMEIGLSNDADSNTAPTANSTHDDFLSEYSGHTFSPEDLLADAGSSPSMSDYRGSLNLDGEPLTGEKKDDDDEEKPDKFDLDSLAF